MKKYSRDDSMSFSEDDGGETEIYRQKFNDISEEDVDPNMYLMEENASERSERLVVRLVPKAIDYTIFLIQITILGSYFYVAYIWEGLKDDSRTCIADINSDVPLSKDAT